MVFPIALGLLLLYNFELFFMIGQVLKIQLVMHCPLDIIFYCTRKNLLTLTSGRIYRYINDSLRISVFQWQNLIMNSK